MTRGKISEYGLQVTCLLAMACVLDGCQRYDAEAAAQFSELITRMAACSPAQDYQGTSVDQHPKCSEFSAILSDLNEFIAEYPRYPNILEMRASFLMIHGEIDAALRDYAECIAICESSPNRHFMEDESDSPYSLSYYYTVRGIARESLLQYDEALSDYLKAYELEGDCFDICDRIALVLTALGREPESAEWQARSDEDAKKDRRPAPLKWAVQARRRAEQR